MKVRAHQYDTVPSTWAPISHHPIYRMALTVKA